MDLREFIRILREASSAEAIDKYREKIIELIPKAHVMIPIVQQRIEIREKLAGEYGVELYRKIEEGF